MENVKNAKYFLLIAIHVQMINAKFVQKLHLSLLNASHLGVSVAQLLMDPITRYVQNVRVSIFLMLLHIVVNAKLANWLMDIVN